MTAPDRDARARKAARLYASGLSKREVARRLGIHHQTVIADLDRLDYGTFGAYRRRLEKRRVPARDKRMAAAAKLRAAGKSLRQIAGELGVSYQTVSNDLARWDAQQPARPANVVPLTRKVSKNGVSFCPPGGKDMTP